MHDVPHLSEEAKRKRLASVPPHMRRAREFGDPVLGEGRIYDLELQDLLYKPRRIPDHWLRVYALDPAWTRTAVLWGALDSDNDVLHLYGEYYSGHKQPRLHASAIMARGKWIPGVSDPAARAGSQKDGEKLIEAYRTAGLKLFPADNFVEAGISACYDRMTTGRLKVSSWLENFRFEFNIYRRDKKQKVVKENDHLMDCMRYMILSGLRIARPRPNFADRTRPRVLVADRTAGY